MGNIKLSINSNMIIKNFTTLLILGFIAYLLNTILYLYLPSKKNEVIEKSSNILEYKRFAIQSGFSKKKKKKEVVKKSKPKEQEYQFLSNMTLLAIYDMGDENGFVTIEEKGKKKTHILSIGEDFKGYKLIKVYAKYAIFSKNSKEFRLFLINDTAIKYSTTKEQKDSEIEKNIKIVDDDKIIVKRDYVNSYIKDIRKIWNNISIAENMSGGRIDGFKITKIKKGSAFEKLGLKENDIIKSVNNVELKSYNDAFKLYRQFNKTKALNIKILRDNLEVEINYEIE